MPLIEGGIFLAWAMVLPMVAVGFLFGSRAAWLLGSLGSLAGGVLFFAGAPADSLAGAWMAYGVLPLLLWGKENQFHEAILASQKIQEELHLRLEMLKREKQDLQLAMASKEEAIQRLGQLYGLSKQFLATLELSPALRTTEEAISQWLPDAEPETIPSCLKKIRSLVEEGKISKDLIFDLLPVERWNPLAKGNWEILSGQLALGLRRVSLYRQVQELATHDGLTGLFTRRAFLVRLKEEIARAHRRGIPLAFLLIDLDHFKQVNDSYGHLVGDLLLKEVAGRIRRSVREIDLVGRYGGEEFAVVLPEADRGLGFQIAERIRRWIEETPVKAYDETLKVTVSIGAALFPQDAPGMTELIEQADRAMYQAKKRGRNQTVAVGS